MNIKADNGLQIEAIHPRNGEKYSPNLHQWLVKSKYPQWAIRAYRDADGCTWVGMMDNGDLFGSRLMGVLCYGKKEDTACWVGIKGLAEVPDFWINYERDGRCAIDTNHQTYYLNSANRWKTTGDHRECQWCGKFNQVLARWTETVECEEWRHNKEESQSA
jgi:hypothetical protein